MMIDRNQRDPLLDEAIAAAKARGPATEAELAAQRASFVRGQVGMGSDRDEAEYRAAARSGDRETMDRLDAESQARVKAPDKGSV